MTIPNNVVLTCDFTTNNGVEGKGVVIDFLFPVFVVMNSSGKLFSINIASVNMSNITITNPEVLINYNKS